MNREKIKKFVNNITVGDNVKLTSDRVNIIGRVRNIFVNDNMRYEINIDGFKYQTNTKGEVTKVKEFCKDVQLLYLYDKFEILNNDLEDVTDSIKEQADEVIN